MVSSFILSYVLSSSSWLDHPVLKLIVRLKSQPEHHFSRLAVSSDKQVRKVLRTRRHTLHGKPRLRARARRSVAGYGTRSLQQAAAAPVHATSLHSSELPAQYREHLIS